MVYNIQIIKDSDANVWVATSTDIPGLVLEDESFESLLQEVKTAVPELLELNGLCAPVSILCHPMEFQLA